MDMKILGNNRLSLLSLAALIGLLVYTLTSKALDRPDGAATASKQVAQVAVEKSPPSRDNKLTGSFAPVIERVGPSVVNIFTSRTVRIDPRRQMPPFFEDPFFQRFFGAPDGDSLRPRPHKQRNLGSGVIVTSDGYILTNDHVVDGADEVKVLLANGNKKEYLAKIVGRDPKTDIAVLKVSANDLPAATLADSTTVKVGDLVLAIGNPFGLGQTVTMGIVSAVGRNNIGIEDYEDFIQTDAAINPGNSGGALVDVEGRVIGINTAILSQTGGNHGIGFAVPVNLARSVMDSIVRDGKVARGYMGVMIQDLTPQLAQAFKMEESRGALVGDVTPESPAQEAGLKSGDLIVALNGQDIQDCRQLRMLVGQKAPGTTVTVKVLREGREHSYKVTLKEMPGDKDDAERVGSTDGGSDDILEGVGVSDLSPAARRQLGLPAGLQGALVTEVDPGSAAYEAQLRKGDVILEINRKPIRNAEEAIEASTRAKNKTTLLRVWSNGGSRFIVVNEDQQK
jgi:serine protease Do